MSDINLSQLAINPPDAPDNSGYDVIGPSYAPEETDADEVIGQFITSLMNNHPKFVLLTRNSLGDEVTWVWDGLGNIPYVLPGHTRNPHGNEPVEEIVYVTCKWYVPTGGELENNDSLALPDDHPYDKALPYLHGCNNPEMGLACGYEFHQPACPGYEPDLVKVPVHFKFPGESKEVLVQSARLNQGIRTFQIVEINSDGETAIMKTGAGSFQDLELVVEEVRASAQEDQDAEELHQQQPRSSFLKGLIPQ